jgi:hypothetical protein
MVSAEARAAFVARQIERLAIWTVDEVKIDRLIAPTVI